MEHGGAAESYDALPAFYSVPFENLDVQRGTVVSLEPEQVYTKIVERHRGGYCYEVN